MIQKQKKDKNYNNSVRIVLELGQNDLQLAKNLGKRVEFYIF